MSTKKSSILFFISITMLLICKSCQQPVPLHVCVGVHSPALVARMDNHCPLGSRLAGGQALPAGALCHSLWVGKRAGGRRLPRKRRWMWVNTEQTQRMKISSLLGSSPGAGASCWSAAPGSGGHGSVCPCGEESLTGCRQMPPARPTFRLF